MPGLLIPDQERRWVSGARGKAGLGLEGESWFLVFPSLSRKRQKWKPLLPISWGNEEAVGG